MRRSTTCCALTLLEEKRSAQVTRAAAEVGKQLNAARAHRGLQPRAVRAVIIGFPNIGKSALVNRLAGRRVASSAAKPGVTRHLTWLRLHGDIDLLDTPGMLRMTSQPELPGRGLDFGACRCEESRDYANAAQRTLVCVSGQIALRSGVLPMSITDQTAAQRLAMCNDIGEAAYVDSLVAAALFSTLRSLPDSDSICARLEERYHVPTKARHECDRLGLRREVFDMRHDEHVNVLRRQSCRLAIDQGWQSCILLLLQDVTGEDFVVLLG